MKQTTLTVTENTGLADGIYRLRLVGDTSAITAPGQFVNLKLSGFFLRRQRQFACFPMPLFVHCCFLFSDSFRRTSLPAPKCRLDFPYCTTIWSFFSLKFIYFSAATHRPRRKRNSAGNNTIFRFCFSHNFRLSTQIRRASAVTAPFHRRPGLQAVAVEQLA